MISIASPGTTVNVTPLETLPCGWSWPTQVVTTSHAHPITKPRVSVQTATPYAAQIHATPTATAVTDPATSSIAVNPEKTSSPTASGARRR